MGTGLENVVAYDKSKSQPKYDGINKSTLDYILKLTQASFFGTVELKFEAGKIVHINQSRSIKP